MGMAGFKGCTCVAEYYGVFHAGGSRQNTTNPNRLTKNIQHKEFAGRA